MRPTFFGALDWWPELLAESLAMSGVGCPRWAGPRGSRANILLASGLLPELASKDEIRSAIFALWAAPPLCLGLQGRKDAGLRGHSLHGSAPDATGFISEFPVVPYALPEDLRRGFTPPETRVAGNWRRCSAQGATESSRVGTAPAAPPGAPDARADSEHVYGRGDGRMSSRAQQLRVRDRLCRFVACALRHARISPESFAPGSMPEGNADWQLVVPEPASAHGDAERS
jgi:hypothetical protein